LSGKGYGRLNFSQVWAPSSREGGALFVVWSETFALASWWHEPDVQRDDA